MKPFFDQENHRKSGRVIILLCTLYLLLAGCVGGLDDFSFLGLKIHVSKDAVMQVLCIGIVYSLLLFSIRAFQSEFWRGFERRQSSASEAYTDWHSVLSSRKGQKINLARAEVQDGPGQPLRSENEDGKNNRLNLEKSIEAEFQKGLKRARWYRKWEPIVGYATFLAVDFGIPLLFIILVLIGVNPTENFCTAS